MSRLNTCRNLIGNNATVLGSSDTNHIEKEGVKLNGFGIRAESCWGRFCDQIKH